MLQCAEFRFAIATRSGSTLGKVKGGGGGPFYSPLRLAGGRVPIACRVKSAPLACNYICFYADESNASGKFLHPEVSTSHSLYLGTPYLLHASGSIPDHCS